MQNLASVLFAQETISAVKIRPVVDVPVELMFSYSLKNIAFSNIPRKITPPIQNYSEFIENHNGLYEMKFPSNLYSQ